MPTESAETLLAKIASAFENAGAVDMRAAEEQEISQEGYECAKLLAGKRWTEIDLEDRYVWECLAWVQPETAALILPAYLVSVVGKPCVVDDENDPKWQILEYLLRGLTPGQPTQWSQGGYYNPIKFMRGEDTRFAKMAQALSEEQKHVVAQVLTYLQDRLGGENPTVSPIGYALDVFWKQYAQDPLTS